MENENGFDYSEDEDELPTSNMSLIDIHKRPKSVFKKISIAVDGVISWANLQLS